MEHGQIDARDIDVDVRQGEAFLKGSVRSRAEKRTAEDVAVSVPDVRDVHNELHVSEYREGERGREMQPEAGSRKGEGSARKNERGGRKRE